MVVARSAAEMPVVTPLRASTETVKAVPRYEVLSATCIVRCSSSQRSSVSGMQMRPRACVAMKLMISGVIFSAAQARSPSFSRSSSSTMMISRPSLMSRAASSMEAKGMLLKLARRLFGRWESRQLCYPKGGRLATGKNGRAAGAGRKSAAAFGG